MKKLIKNGCKNYKSNVKGMGSFVMIFYNSVNIETEGYYGISHLIEHCMCNQLKNYELDFEKYGINYNASTNLTYVDFYLTGLDEGVIKFRDLFYDLVVNYQIPEEVFERERKIVIQEFNDILGRPRSVFNENILRKFFNIRSPLGEKKDLQNLTYDKFIEYKNKHFSKPTFICNTSSSKIKKDEFETQRIQLNLIDLTGSDSIGLPMHKPFVSDTSRNICYLSKFTYDQKTLEEYLYYSLIAKYLCYGLSSPLYKDLREKTGHIYSVSAAAETLLEEGNASFSIFVSTEPKYEEEIKEKLLECLNTHLNSVDRKIFDSVIIGWKNSLKKANLLSFSKNNTFNSYYIDVCKKFEFDFEKFKEYSKKLLKNNYFLFNDVTY